MNLQNFLNKKLYTVEKMGDSSKAILYLNYFIITQNISKIIRNFFFWDHIYFPSPSRLATCTTASYLCWKKTSI